MKKFSQDEKSNRIIWVLLILVVLLIIILLIFLVIKPLVNKSKVAAQNEAFETGYFRGQYEFLNGIVTQLNQQGFVQIVLNENQSIFLQPFIPSGLNA